MWRGCWVAQAPHLFYSKVQREFKVWRQMESKPRAARTTHQLPSATLIYSLMRQHLDLLPVLASSEMIGGQGCADSGPFQATPSGQRTRWHRPLKRKATLIVLQHCGFSSTCWAYCRVLASLRYTSLPKLVFEVVWCVLHCWVLPVGSSTVQREYGPGQEEELFSQSHFDLPFAVLWGHVVAGTEGWCFSAFCCDAVLKEVHFQTALLPVAAFHVALGFIFQPPTVFFPNYPGVTVSIYLCLIVPMCC